MRPEFPAREYPRPAAYRCAATEPLSVPLFRPVQPARQGVLAVQSARLSGRPHSVGASVRRAAAVAPSCFRQAEERRSAAQSEPAWWQAPAAAWHQTAVAAEAE